jgi:hypothetical protein
MQRADRRHAAFGSLDKALGADLSDQEVRDQIRRRRKLEPPMRNCVLQKPPDVGRVEFARARAWHHAREGALDDRENGVVKAARQTPKVLLSRDQPERRSNGFEAVPTLGSSGSSVAHRAAESLAGQKRLRPPFAATRGDR